MKAVQRNRPFPALSPLFQVSCDCDHVPFDPVCLPPERAKSALALLSLSTHYGQKSRAAGRLRAIYAPYT